MYKVTIPYYILALNKRLGLKEDHFQAKSEVEVLKDTLLEVKQEHGFRGCDLSHTFEQIHAQLAEMREGE